MGDTFCFDFIFSFTLIKINFYTVIRIRRIIINCTDYNYSDNYDVT